MFGDDPYRAEQDGVVEGRCQECGSQRVGESALVERWHVPGGRSGDVSQEEGAGRVPGGGSGDVSQEEGAGMCPRRNVGESQVCQAQLKRSRLKVRFCTNESQKSLEYLVGLLRGLGFDISEGDVTAPAPATCLILKERGLRPHLLISDGIRSEFDQIDTSNPNCVVMADAGEGFSYQNMNKAFQVLMELENPVLISLGKGRYYKETSGLMLDIGAYVKALEYACGIEAEVVGKPSPEFFKSALREMGVEAHQVGRVHVDAAVLGEAQSTHAVAALGQRLV
ncbi:hypothetical protein HPG69_009540 [Diceros bicornis minor]|uniref:Phospholysine phosphohistidine inorganic pyrophosphate phosphatase n=1 Tax=Diceros bicornis minor TaxID=77932 RepID=A0A7J7EM67_DICBM|nr:hypothetical protein HPG69_009540 [Diceros bicornis minor]